MSLEQALEELRSDPAHWAGYDDETRYLLRQAAKPTQVLQKDFCPLTGERRITDDHKAL